MPHSGWTSLLCGHRVAAPSTLGTFLRAFTFGHVRVLAEALGRGWAAGAEPRDERLVVDLDSFVGEVHGYQKRGAGFGYTRQLRLPPARGRRAPTPARCSTSACTRARPRALAGRCASSTS